jgi:hypothetical protein
MFNGLGLGEGSGSGDLLPFMQQMMQSLLSKDILYPALKDIVDKVFCSIECSYCTLSFESRLLLSSGAPEDESSLLSNTVFV